MLPVNLQTNLRSKQDTQMNNYVILTTSEEEEETFPLLKTSKTLEVLSWIDMQEEEEVSSWLIVILL